MRPHAAALLVICLSACGADERSAAPARPAATPTATPLATGLDGTYTRRLTARDIVRSGAASKRCGDRSTEGPCGLPILIDKYVLIVDGERLAIKPAAVAHDRYHEYAIERAGRRFSAVRDDDSPWSTCADADFSGGPVGHYRWRTRARTLRVTLAGKERCCDRAAMLVGVWTHR